MVGLTVRQLWKHTLSILRVKLLVFALNLYQYSRITLTRFTTFYFFIALGTCIVLSALQGLAFVDNSQAVTALAPLVKNVSMAQVLVLEKGVLQTCTSIPNQPGTKCTVKLVFGANTGKAKRDLSDGSPQWARHWDDEEDVVDIDDGAADEDSGSLRNGSSSNTSTGVLSNNSGLSDNCLLSLAWVDEILEDSKREDVVTFLFQVWLFSLALVTILNESIPHLGAAFFGHVLGTGWAGYRISSSQALTRLYRNHIVPEACGGQDVLGGWWDTRIQHAIPIVIINSIVLVAFLFVSAKLYKVYANESFSRVGASSQVHRMYKIVLLFSVGLQLSGFFSLASSAMWIDKVCHGMMKEMARHSNLYLAAFIVILVFQFPWLYLGWVCVRRECRVRFGIFCAISAFLLTISTLMYFSPLYRYIFMTWPFFATVTVTAYALNVFTSVLAVICRLNFGKGLAHYLQVTDALEGVDFTPVSFWKGYDGDPEKANLDEKANKNFTSTGQDSAQPSSRNINITLQLPALALARQPSANLGVGRQRMQDRGSSIYSEDAGTPIMLSSSPPLISEMGPAPSRLSKAAVVRSRSMSQSQGHGHSKSQSLGQSQSSVAMAYPPGLQAHISALGEREKEDTSDEDEGSEASPVSTLGPALPPKARASPVVDRVAETGDILTRVPTRSSSIQSKRSSSSRRKLVKQGLPASPRSRVL